MTWIDGTIRWVNTLERALKSPLPIKSIPRDIFCCWKWLVGRKLLVQAFFGLVQIPGTFFFWKDLKENRPSGRFLKIVEIMDRPLGNPNIPLRMEGVLLQKKKVRVFEKMGFTHLSLIYSKQSLWRRDLGVQNSIFHKDWKVLTDQRWRSNPCAPARY